MFGTIIGDIVGSRFEFDDHKSKDFALFGNDGIMDIPCEYTDDSVMTVAVAESLLDRKGGESDDVFKKRLVERMHPQGRKRMNAGFGTLLYRWLRDGSAEPYGSWGNGSAARAAPAGWAAGTLAEAEHLAGLTAEVTHNHPEGIKGARAVAAAIWLARHGKDKEEIRQYIERTYYPDAFQRRLDELRLEYAFDASCRGTVPVALEACYESDSFEDTLRNAVSVGGDSDTLTGIAAGIAEAYYGIPDPIRREAMAFLDEEMRRIAVRFAERYQK